MDNKRESKKPKNTPHKELLDVRKSFIDKVQTWDFKIVYGFMLFYAAVALSMMTQGDKFQAITGIHPLFVLLVAIFSFPVIVMIIEGMAVNRMYRMHKKLIEDIKNQELDNIEEFTWKKYIQSKL